RRPSPLRSRKTVPASGRGGGGAGCGGGDIPSAAAARSAPSSTRIGDENVRRTAMRRDDATPACRTYDPRGMSAAVLWAAASEVWVRARVLGVGARVVALGCSAVAPGAHLIARRDLPSLPRPMRRRRVLGRLARR